MKFRRLLIGFGFTIAAAAPLANPAHAYTLGQLVNATSAPSTAVFASVEVRAESAPQITQWRGVMRAADHGRYLRACLSDQSRCPGHFGATWRAMMGSARHMDRLAQAKAVNSFFNGLTYRTDAQVYGRSDHWARPVEFMTRGAGDCEDFAIAKFYSLKLLGVADQDQRIVALYDRIEGVGHAVLTVAVHGTRYVLDNRSDQVFPESRYRYYEPLLSMNESGEWRNIQRQQPQAASLASISSALTFR